MICKEPNCKKQEYCKGFCSKHYGRLRTTGTTADGPKARGTLRNRFWKKVDIRSESECWPWVGKTKIQGYGAISVGGRRSGKILSHRAAWVLSVGEIPTGLGPHGTVVMHKCDNRACCNPSHLMLGSQKDNVLDMDKKGRRKVVVTKGEKHHNSRFAEDDIRYIRSSEKSSADLAREFGCARQVVGSIRRRKTWKHVK